MKTTPTPSLTPAQAEALQARFAQRLSARLDHGAQHLPHDITERLRVARLQALAAAQAQRGLAARTAAEAKAVTLTAPAGLTLAGAGSGAAPGSVHVPHGHRSRRGSAADPQDDTPSWALKLASFLPLLALLAGLWGIHQWAHREQVQAAAEVDTALLTDDLPPAAYADPGFEEYLLSSTGHGNADLLMPDTAPTAAEQEGLLPESESDASASAGPSV